MTSFFSNVFTTDMQATTTMGAATATKVFDIILFRHAPQFFQNDPRYTPISSLSELLSMPGWVEVSGPGYPFASTITLTTTAGSGSILSAIAASPFALSVIQKTEVEAIGLVIHQTVGGVVNPLVMVSNTLFGKGRLLNPTDAIDATAAGGFFTWIYPSGSVPLEISEGTATILPGAPSYETAHTTHVWMKPQRANMIANPSFEKDTAYWSSNGAITRIPVVTNVGAWSGQFAGLPPLIAESNVFPTMQAEDWTVQARVRGTGQVRIGLVYWDSEFQQTMTDWGAVTQVWNLSSSFLPLAVLRHAPQSSYAMVRIEAFGAGAALEIDQVLAEKEFLKDWPYFDGDTNYGALNDFSWYGGTSKRGASYSFWYNNRNTLVGRLFATYIDPALLITDDVLASQGMVYEWVPAGTTVIPHMDVLYAGDIQAGPIPKHVWRSSAGVFTNVLRYKTSDSDYYGVTNPWV